MKRSEIASVALVLAALVAVFGMLFVSGMNYPPILDQCALDAIYGEGTTAEKERLTVVTIPDGTVEYYIWGDDGWERWEPVPQPQTQEGD